MRRLIIFFSLSFSLASYAQNCKSISQVQVPGAFLEEFFKPSQNNKKYFFTLPESYCSQVGKRIQLMDPYGNEAGTFTVRQQWTGKYNLDTLSNSPRESLPVMYQEFLKSKILDDTSLTTLMRLSFDPDFSLEKSSVHLLEGGFVVNDRYTLNWNIKTEPLSLKTVKKIDYEGVVDLLGSSLVIDALPDSPSRPKNNWKIPTAIASPLPPRFPCGLSNWREILSLSQSIKFEKYQDKKNQPVIVYSSYLEPSCAINTIVYLQLQGFKDVRWFELAAREWQYGAEKARQDQMKPDIKQINGAEILKMKSSPDVAIIDVRSEDLYKQGHIPGAFNNQFILVNVSDFNKQTKATPWAKSMVNQKMETAGIFKTTFEKMLSDKMTTVIFYTQTFLPTDFVGVAKQLHRHHKMPEKLKVYFYQGGMAEWIGAAEWQPDLYKIESKSN
ncbi:hypothetical protein AZI86_16180 [Bdellovibrio bacteriovorus]|uniref:Rhodanese domain-containing protein n=1 Tax=Bdellovibrio bacteriovorus TaxID=959 RepID=A0A150WGX1_BDEBC|nr:rhodanese-like domain-containing protein [Bdellovibrio bacteriovorus]KYG62374.1 hypothetical protein AZI86_16180 [Bdellovibrio bacteriovorus]